MNPLRLAFAGTPDFAAQHLAALLDTPHTLAAVLTQPDRPAGRGKKPRPSPVKALALGQAPLAQGQAPLTQGQALPVLQPQSLRDEATQAQLRDLELDALIVVAYGLILPQAVLDIPRYGCLNVHGSLLPRWRGAAPIQRAIEAGDSESGVTIMQMDAGLDTGPILARAPCAIPPLATSGDLYTLLAELGPEELCAVLEDLPAFIDNAEPQDDSLATYAHKIDKQEAALDWSSPAAELARRVRAFNPAPGCFSFLGGERVKIWEALPQPEGSVGIPVGTITSAGDEGVGVACGTNGTGTLATNGTGRREGTGTLLIKTLQLPGSKAMSAAELLRGHSEALRVGACFQGLDENPST